MSTPSRRRAWRTVLAALVGLATAAATPTAPTALAAGQTITVDLAATTGAVLHGGNGSLYGLSDDGVPGDNLVAPLKLTTVAQKPPAGLQHPNGDALVVANSLRRNGGGDIYVYLQDIYAQWPYENNGLADYLSKLDTMVRAMAGHPERAHFVYVPFNEPDWIWYGLNTTDAATYRANRDRFLADWKTVFQRIRSIHPGARIAGPNEAYYDARLLADFLPWAKANNVLPDVMTWHELSADSLRTYRASYRAYRELERANGIAPLPINIDEYGNRRDLSVPGQLVQWVSMFEDTKVYADQAYWDIAGNMDGNAVQTNIPNGSWWFFHWYAEMSGQTVRVSPPQPSTIDTLQGLASLDTGKKQAHVIVGGTSGDNTVAIRHVPPAVFGSSVVATVQEVAWSGYEGASAPPRTLNRQVHRVAADGSVTVPLTAMTPMSAYRIVLTPAGTGTPDAANPAWQSSYEAENGTITDGVVYTQGTVANANGYATSGTKDVGSLNKSTSRVDFRVTVPATGQYSLRVLYGNQGDAPAQQVLRVDGGSARFVDYPSTLNWTYRASVTVPVTLTAGAHTLTLSTSDSSLGAARGEVTLDRIDLVAATGTPTTDYPAALAEVTGSAAYDYARSSGLGTGEVVLSTGGRATFDTYAPADGYYQVLVDHTGGAGTLSLNGNRLAALPATTTADRTATPLRVFLVAGINRLSVGPDGSAPLRVAAVRVSGDPDSTGVSSVEAEHATLTGTAAASNNAFASGGRAVGWLGNGAGNTLTFTGITAASAGRYWLIVSYANNERSGSGNYNTNIVSRGVDIRVNGGAAQRVMFRNTYSWNQFWRLAVPVTLSAGNNTISLGNASGYAPDIDRIQLARW